MIEKRILVPQRLRRPPATGWSWVDRRFLREHGDHLSREAILLYLFLAAVADQHGLSFYSDNTLSSRLRLPLPALEKARQELLERDLIAYQLPLVQVLSVASPRIRRRTEAAPLSVESDAASGSGKSLPSALSPNSSIKSQLPFQERIAMERQHRVQEPRLP